MTGTYELRAGRRPVGYRTAPSAQVALLDYVHSLGCRDDEITRLGRDAVSWRGAVYKAVQFTGKPPATVLRG